MSSARAACLDLLGRGVFRHGHQDVGEVVFRFHALLGLRLQIAFDFGIADGDPVVDIAFAGACDEELVADSGAHAVESLAVFFEGGLQAGHVEFVLRRDALQGVFDLGRIDADPGGAGVLLQCEFGDHAFEQLLLQHVARRQRGVLPRQGAHDFVVTPGEFLVGDDLVVDDGDDAIELLHGGVGRHQGRYGDQQRQYPLGAAPLRAFE